MTLHEQAARCFKSDEGCYIPMPHEEVFVWTSNGPVGFIPATSASYWSFMTSSRLNGGKTAVDDALHICVKKALRRIDDAKQALSTFVGVEPHFATCRFVDVRCSLVGASMALHVDALITCIRKAGTSKEPSIIDEVINFDFLEDV